MKNFILLFSSLMLNLFSYAQQGANDPTFNIIDTTLSMLGPSNRVNTICVQSDGKILVGGVLRTYNNNVVNGIARIDSTGKIDASFTAIGGVNSSIMKIIQQPDGKILVGGSFSLFNNMQKNNLVRLNSNGTIDSNFISGFGPNNTVQNIVLQPDGKILVVGNFTAYNNVAVQKFVRLNNNGTLDTTFILPQLITSQNNAIWGLDIQTDGKILVGATFVALTNDTSFQITRILPSGQFDTTFISNFNFGVVKLGVLNNNMILIGTASNGLKRLFSNGLIDTTFASNNQFPMVFYNRVFDYVINSKNEIILTGFAFDSTFNNKIVYSRLDSNGYVIQNSILKNNLNSFFGTSIVLTPNDGVIIGSASEYYNDFYKPFLVSVDSNGIMNNWFNLNNGFNGTVFDVFVLSDDKILVGGLFSTYNGKNTGNLVRLFSDGALDTSFNSIIKIWSISSISEHTDGRIVVCGNLFINNQFTNIAQLNADGTIDINFITGSGFDASVNQVKTTPNGKIFVCGSFTTYNNINVPPLIRLNSNGTLDNTFNLKHFNTKANGIISSFDFQSDGKIIVGGNFVFSNYPLMQSLLRVQSDGNFDLSFNGPTSILPFHPANSEIKKVVVQSDNKIIVAGTFTSYNNTNCSGIIRLDSNGIVDQTFVYQTGFLSNSSNFSVNDIFKYPNDNIIAVGEFSSYNNASMNRIVKINTNGSVDNSFNSNLGANNTINSIDIQSSGKLIIGGSFSLYDNAVRTGIARVNSYPVSINEFYVNSTIFNVQPNPVSEGIISVKTNSNALYNIDIIDVYGRNVLYSKKLQGNTILNTSSLTSGVYFVQIYFDNKKEVKKIIVKN